MNDRLIQLKKNIYSGSFLSVLSTILIFIAYPIYLEKVGAELYGVWVLVSLILSLSQVGELGINDSLIKFVAASYKKNDKDLIGYCTSYIAFILFVSTGIVTVIHFSVDNIISWLDPPTKFRDLSKQLLSAVNILVLVAFVNNAMKGILTGIGRIDKANYMFLVSRTLQIIFSLILLFLGLGIWALFYSYIFFFLMTVLLYGLVLSNEKIIFFRIEQFSINKLKNMLSLGYVIFTTKMIEKFGVDEFIKVLIAKLFGLSQLTYYEISFKVIMAIRSVYDIAFKAIIPHSGSIATGNKFKKTVQDDYIYIVKKFILPTIPFVILFIFISKPVIKLWLGAEYNEQIWSNFIILYIPYILNIVSIPIYYIYIGLGNKKFIALSTLIGVSIFYLCLIINYTIKFGYGINGIIISYGTMIFINAVFINLYFYNNIIKKVKV